MDGTEGLRRIDVHEVRLEQRVIGGDVGVIEGQQPDADDGGLLIDAETLDAEVADLLAHILPMTHHECPGVVRLTVGHAGYGELPDEIPGRIQVLEPLISGDSALGRFPGSGDRCVLQHGVNGLIMDWMLPDLALECPQSRPDSRRSRCHGMEYPLHGVTARQLPDSAHNRSCEGPASSRRDRPEFSS
jgi:hypothetical protein